MESVRDDLPEAVDEVIYGTVRFGTWWLMTYDIPPLRRLEDTPPIVTQEGLCQFWRSLMGKLGFSERCLWALTLDKDGYIQPGMVQIGQCPLMPDRLILRSLMKTLREAIRDDPQRDSIAFLWSRPGSVETRNTDIAWATALIDEVRRAKAPMWPVHFANDHDLRVFAPDELAA